jgi:hypothetical protein
MRQLRALSFFLMLSGVLALALVGCGETATAKGTASQLTQSNLFYARAILTSAFPQNHIPPFDKMSTDPAKAMAFYKALLALPVMPRGTYYCPIDFGSVYHLTFYSASGRIVAHATVKPDGCETATLPNGVQHWAEGSPNFWASFAAAMNVPQSALSPQTHASGPSAPTSLPN